MPSITIPTLGNRNRQNNQSGQGQAPPPPSLEEQLTRWRGSGIPEPALPPPNPFPVPQVPPIQFGDPSGMQSWSSGPSHGMGGGKSGKGGGGYGGNTNMPSLPGGGVPMGGYGDGQRMSQQGWGGGQGDMGQLWQLISQMLMPRMAQ